MKFALGRARDLLLKPGRTWEALADERADARALTWAYVAPLAAIPVVCRLVGRLILGESLMGITYRPHILVALGETVLAFLLTLAGVWLLAAVVNGLAPLFGGVRDYRRAFAVSAYFGTPVWVLGVLNLVPAIGWLGMLAGALWSLVLLYLGLPRLMRPEADKAVSYFATALLTVLALGVLFGVLISMVRDQGGPLTIA